LAKLSGIEIYKHLPRTNCGDCGLPTCMAFALQVASKKLPLDGCPHVSGEARTALGDAQTPPMATLAIGPEGASRTLGGETVMHRHEERFQNAPVLAVRVRATLSDAEIDKRVAAIRELRFERVGKTVGVDAIAMEAGDAKPERFRTVVQRVAERTQLLLFLLCEDPGICSPAARGIAARRPLLVAATETQAEDMAGLALELKLPLVIRAPGSDASASLVERISASGARQLLLDPQPAGLAEAIGDLTQLRRLALEQGVRSAGYPSYVDIGTLTRGVHDPDKRTAAEMVAGVSLIMRYASVLVVDTIEAWAIHPLVTARQDIYTDPQVPNTVEAKLYEIGNPGPDAPVLVTTNFALTYFTVAGEVANSRVPAFISVIDTEGLGVLNAYADDRLTVERLVDVVRDQGGMDRVSHNRLIIPGLVARLRMGIEDASGWNIIVGPESSSGIPHFLRELKSTWEQGE